MNIEKPKTPRSQIDWQKKYDAEKMDVVGIKCPKAEKELYRRKAAENDMKLASYVRKCVKYCIQNNIDIKNFELPIIKNK